MYRNIHIVLLKEFSKDIKLISLHCIIITCTKNQTHLILTHSIQMDQEHLMPGLHRKTIAETA